MAYRPRRGSTDAALRLGIQGELALGISQAHSHGFIMAQPEIELRRQQLSEEFLALRNGGCARGLEICEEFGQTAEEEDNLLRSGRSDHFSEIAEGKDRRR